MVRGTVACVIPWRPTPGRTRHLAAVQAVLRSVLPDAPIHLADDGSHPFSRAGSRNVGVRDAGADVVVVCDGDTIPQPAPLLEAVAQAQDGALHLPYETCRLLTRAGTDAYHRGTPADQCQAEPFEPTSSGGVLVLTPRTWDRLGGQDTRFVGWGMEDAAMWAVAKTLTGVTRHQGRIYHLWHPDDRQIGSTQYHRNLELCRRYTDARGDADTLTELAGEHR